MVEDHIQKLKKDQKQLETNENTGLHDFVEDIEPDRNDCDVHGITTAPSLGWNFMYTNSFGPSNIQRTNTIGSEGLLANGYNLQPTWMLDNDHTLNINTQHSLLSPQIGQQFSFPSQLELSSEYNLLNSLDYNDPTVVPLYNELDDVCKPPLKRRAVMQQDYMNSMPMDNKPNTAHETRTSSTSAADLNLHDQNHGHVTRSVAQRKHRSTIDSYDALIKQEDDDFEEGDDEDNDEISVSSKKPELKEILDTLGIKKRKDGKRLYIRKAMLNKDQQEKVEKFRKIQKRERNRILAAESRQRKKEKLEILQQEKNELEDREAEWKRKYNAISKENQALRNRIAELESRARTG